MIVPQYWAEARLQNRDRKRQVTVRRFGWSDLSQADAQRHAEDRARDALSRILAGERLHHRDHKIPYNGADGLPIREEIVDRHGDVVITRNSYGALCLNTPDVLFADIDFSDQTPRGSSALLGGVSLIIAGVAGAITRSWEVAFSVAAVGFLCVFLISGFIVLTNYLGGGEDIARSRIERFAAAHTDWRFRLYRTPAGFRILVMHRTFDPQEVAVIQLFRAVHVDRMYRRMCYNQKCFRARVTAKPWRIGIQRHMKPQPGIWPVAAERLLDRQRWIAEYGAAAKNFAACRFVEEIGDGPVDSKAAAVARLHDEMCRAESDFQIA
jgi:hypothetical protein